MPAQWLTDNGFINFLIWLGFIIALIEILTFVHEMGHFAVAKLNKVDVAEFSIGFGPKVFQFGKKTKYTLRWIPFGGYVSVLTDDVVNILEKIQNNETDPNTAQSLSRMIKPFEPNYDFRDKKTLEKISHSKRVLFAMGGIIFNLVFMFIFVWISVASIGTPQETQKSFIRCYQEGNQLTITSSNIIEIDNNFDGSSFSSDQTINGFDEFWTYLNQFDSPTTAPASSAFKIITSSNCVDNNTPGELTSYWSNSTNQWNRFTTNLPYFNPNIASPFSFTNDLMQEEYIYQQYLYEVKGNSFTNAWVETFTEIGNSFLLLFTFGSVEIDNLPNNHQSYLLFSENSADNSYILGWFAFLNYVVLFSGLLIIFNILPIPPLDGFRAVEWTVEGTTGKKLSPEKQAQITRIGWTVILIWTMFLLFFPLFLI